MNEPLHVFQIRTATMYRLFNHRTNMGVGHQFFIAPNPPYGASITYFLEAAPPGGAQAQVTILDKAGTVVREFDAPAAAGVNRVSWDLRYSSPLKAPAGLRSDPPGQPGGPRMRVLTLSQGPLVLPGDYVVRVKVGMLVGSAPVRVKEDPHIRIGDAELRDHRTAWHRLFWLYVDSNGMVQRTVALRRATETWLAALGTSGRGNDALAASGAALLKRIEGIQTRLATRYNYSVGFTGYVDPGTGMGGGLTNRAGQILLTVGNYTGRPTPRHAAMIDEMTEEFRALRDEFNMLIEREVPLLNQQAREGKRPEMATVPAVPAPTVPKGLPS